MRIPHGIHPSTIKVYEPSSQAMSLLTEILASVRPGNLEWEPCEVETLVDIALKVIANNFHKYPYVYFELPRPDREHLIEFLSTDLPLEMVIPLIKEDYYFERRYHDHYGIEVESRYQGGCWKHYYMERHLRRLCEEALPQYSDEKDYDDILILMEPYIQVLTIKEMKNWDPPRTMSKKDYPVKYPIYHIDLTPILKRLPNLEVLKICYCVKNVGMNYENRMFEVDTDDFDKLGSAINQLPELKFLCVYNSNINCQHMRLLAKHLVQNDKIEALNFRNCKIEDEGAKCCAVLIYKIQNLKWLNLRCNKIGPVGAQGLAYALTYPSGLQRLDLGLNPLGNKGIMYLSSALLRSPIPKELMLNGCGFSADRAITFMSCLKHNTTLKKLDMSGNDLGEECGKVFVNILQNNQDLIKLDVKSCGISDETVEELNSIVRVNYEQYLMKMKNSIMKNKRTSKDSTDSSDEEPISYLASTFSMISQRTLGSYK